MELTQQQLNTIATLNSVVAVTTGALNNTKPKELVESSLSLKTNMEIRNINDLNEVLSQALTIIKDICKDYHAES